MYKRLVIVITCAMLISCMQEDYHRPAIAVGSKWDIKDAYTKPDQLINLAYLQWWRDFQDPTLEQFMIRALKCNTKVLISKSRIDEALGELKKVRNQWIPNTEFWTGYANNPMLGFPGTLFVFIPSYFINFYQQYHEYKISRIQLAQTRAEDDVVKLLVISEIANSYFGYQAFKDYAFLLDCLYDDLLHLAEIAKKMHQDGLIPDIEPHAIANQVMRIEGEKHLTYRNIIRMRNALRYLINKNPGKIPTCKVFTELMTKPKVIGAVPMRVLLNRPDLKVAEFRLRAAFYNIKLAQSPFLPRFEFDMYPGLRGGINSYAFPSHYIKYNDQLLKVSVFKWSVLGEIDKARGQKKAVFYQFLDVLRAALRDTLSAYINHDRTTRNLQNIEQATAQVLLVYQRNKSLKEQGIQSEFAMLASKIEYDRMRLVLNRAQLQQLLSIVRLYQELAGGYADEDKFKNMTIGK